MARRTEITLHPTDGLRYEIRRGSTVLLPAPVDAEYALQEAARLRTPTERVIRIESDGYRIDVTNDVKRLRR